MKTAAKSAVMMALAILLATTGAQAAGTIILSGSDTIGLHEVITEAAAAYNFLSNGGTGGVLQVNNSGNSFPTYGGGGFGPFTSSATLPADLSGFTGIMYSSPFNCCSDPGPTVSAADALRVQAFVAAGGNLYIEDFEGNPVWDAILGFDGSQGLLVSTGCTGDPGVPTAQGAAFGYVGGSFGCYTHQIYDAAFYAPFGYVSLVDGCEGSSGPGPGVICGSVILGSGEAAVPQVPGVPGVPMPATLMLLGSGLLSGMLASGLRRRRA